MNARLVHGTWASGCRSLRCHAISAAYAPAVPSSAPSNASAPVVAAVIVRRVRLLAPVAVNVRMSRPASLRMRPTVIASTPNATRIPAAVDQLRSGANDLGAERVSMTNPDDAAARRAASFCADVRADGAWISHACGVADKPRVRIAFGVISTAGSEPNVGS